jgi:hypothetical protein
VGGPTPLTAAGDDPTSRGVEAILAARSAQFAALVHHSGLLREQGGQVLSATAGQFGSADDDAAARFGGGPVGAVGAAAVSAAAGLAVPAPALPAIPAMPPPPTMLGDVFSQLVHANPTGSARPARGRVAVAQQCGDAACNYR